MHSIRSKAHRHAWYGERDPSFKYSNPITLRLRYVRERFSQRSQAKEEKANKKTRKQHNISVAKQAVALFAPRINLLLPLVPTGFAMYYTHRSSVAVFVVNFIAMFPVSVMLALSINEATYYLGSQFGELLSMSLSNVAQLITSIFLLKTRQFALLEASLLGSILQNLLLMTGLAFVVGGIKFEEQYFGSKIAQTICMLLLLAVLSLLIPTLAQVLGESDDASILKMSRGTAIIIIASYVLYLVFSTITDQKVFKSIKPMKGKRRGVTHVDVQLVDVSKTLTGSTASTIVKGAAVSIGNAEQGVQDNRRQEFEEVVCSEAEDEDEDEYVPQLMLVTALITVLVCTTLLAFHASFATDAIQDFMSRSSVSDTFVGIVVLPLLGNDLGCITMASLDRVDSSIALSLERCMQTALLVVPLIVLIAWGQGLDQISMEFNKFLVATTFGAIIIVSYVVQEGRCNWLYGALLIKIFVIISLAAFFTT